MSSRGLSALPIVFSFPACLEDSRANRLESWSFRANGGATSIFMCTAADVVDRLAAGLSRLGYHASRLDVTDPDDRRKWTHALDIDSPPTTDVEDLLNLFHETLVLRRPTGLESAMALDWYKDPTSDDDPNNWAYTEVGRLVASAKYGRNAFKLTPLCDRLAAVIQRHPIYRECVIATVPGHDSSAGDLKRVIAALKDPTGRAYDQLALTLS